MSPRGRSRKMFGERLISQLFQKSAQRRGCDMAVPSQIDQSEPFRLWGGGRGRHAPQTARA
eukprot:4920029-Pyramimonas_sp.AAC.1